MAPAGFEASGGALRFVLERTDDPAVRVVDEASFLVPGGTHGG
jgi:hypothetical protein